MKAKPHHTWFACLFLICLLVGCSGEAEVHLSVQGFQGSDDVPSIMVTFRDGERIRRVHLNSTTRTAGPFSTKTSGELDVTCSILTAQDEIKRGGSITLPLRDDWRWGVDFYISVDDPSEMCFGCFGSESFALDPALGYAEDKKLFIIWGGNSISHPVVY
jgi:hypothetical protein